MTILKYYSYIVIANVILSWLVAFNIINTGNRFVYSVLDFTYRMTEPFLNRIRAFLPNLGAFDISPVILLMLIWIMQMCMEYYIRPIIQNIMNLIDGKKIAAELRNELKVEVENIKKKFNKVLRLSY